MVVVEGANTGDVCALGHSEERSGRGPACEHGLRIGGEVALAHAPGDCLQHRVLRLHPGSVGVDHEPHLLETSVHHLIEHRLKSALQIGIGR